MSLIQVYSKNFENGKEQVAKLRCVAKFYLGIIEASSRHA